MEASGGSDRIIFGSDSMERRERISFGIENLTDAIHLATKDKRITENASTIMANLFYRNTAVLMNLDVDAANERTE